jgi:hypothetical protein
MSIILKEEELDLLSGLPHMHFTLYVKAIRPYMDTKTGMVGVKRKISWQSLKECIYVEPRKGIKYKQISIQQIRRAVRFLEKIGLIETKSEDFYLIFYCVLWGKGECVQNKADRGPTFKPTELKVIKNPINKDENATEEDQNRHPKNEKADTPLTSIDIYNKLYISNICRFEEFWSVYPRKENKKKALDIWKRKKVEEFAEIVIADVLKRKEQHSQWKSGFIPHATTYLNGERWNDEITETNNYDNNNRQNIHNRYDRSVMAVFKVCAEEGY